MSGFTSPNYTQAPNDLFDDLLKKIEDLSELKVTLTVIRYTFGFHRQRAELSQTFLMRATGMTEKAVKRGIKLAIARGTIRVAQPYTSTSGTVYEVVIQGDSGEPPPPEPPRKKEYTKKNNSTEISKNEISVLGESSPFTAEDYERAKSAMADYDFRVATIALKAKTDTEKKKLIDSVPKPSGYIIDGMYGKAHAKKMTQELRHVSLDNMFDEEKPKKTILEPRTEHAKWLSANARYGRDRHWEGFTSAKQRDEWELMEKEYPSDVIKSKMKWALDSRFGRRILADRIITAVHNYGQRKKPESKPIEVSF